MYMSKWTIADARRRFSDVLNGVVREPQAIYRRNQRIAAVVDATELDAFEEWRRRERERTLADEFRELRTLTEEDAPLEAPARRDRPNAFARKR